MKPDPHSERVAASLQYDGRGSTPRVTASGHAEVADWIIAEAKRQGVPIAQDPRLAEALAAMPLNTEIPEELYTAVAIILAWSYWLRDLTP